MIYPHILQYGDGGNFLGNLLTQLQTNQLFLQILVKLGSIVYIHTKNAFMLLMKKFF